MQKPKQKKTAAEKEQKKLIQIKFMNIFINGKQKRVRRPETIEGIPLDYFLQKNADPIFLHQNGDWDILNDNGDTE